MYEVLMRGYEVKKTSLDKWNHVKSKPLYESETSGKRKHEEEEEQVEMKLVAKTGNVMRGHTSYLTFAKYISQQ
jgi:hypothetical protein